MAPKGVPQCIELKQAGVSCCLGMRLFVWTVGGLHSVEEYVNLIKCSSYKEEKQGLMGSFRLWEAPG